MFAPHRLSRLMLTGFVVIFLCVGLLFGISYLSMQDNEINARLCRPYHPNAGYCRFGRSASTIGT